MPIHDWTRVRPGIFHAFHVTWMAKLQGSLNSRQLPPDYYALQEPASGRSKVELAGLSSESDRFMNKSEADLYAAKTNILAIRHGGTDRVVAVLNVVSPGNKNSQHALQSFVKKAAVMLNHGVNLMIVDLYPPTPNDPNGIHSAIWETLGQNSFSVVTEKPLMLASYIGTPMLQAFIEPVAVGDSLPSMPLFLTPDEYVSVPLEETYMQAYEGMPDEYLDILEENRP